MTTYWHGFVKEALMPRKPTRPPDFIKGKANTLCQLCKKVKWNRVIIDKTGNIHVCDGCRKMVITE